MVRFTFNLCRVRLKVFVFLSWFGQAVSISAGVFLCSVGSLWFGPVVDQPGLESKGR